MRVMPDLLRNSLSMDDDFEIDFVGGEDCLQLHTFLFSVLFQICVSLFNSVSVVFKSLLRTMC